MSEPTTIDYGQAKEIHPRPCTCYPGEGPIPCPRKYAFRDCWKAAVLDETQKHISALKQVDRHKHEQELLDYLMRVRTALEV
jgi:hypothetical protein